MSIKKMAWATAVSSMLMFAACGDDGSSSAPGEETNLEESSSSEELEVSSSSVESSSGKAKSSSSKIREEDEDEPGADRKKSSDSKATSSSSEESEAAGSSDSSVESSASQSSGELNPDVTYGKMTDSRDNKTYKTVKIGDQVWMAENLNHQTASSWCYNDADSNCTKYGSLYTWVETMGKMPADCDTTMSCKMFETVQGICPDNWHVPTKLEWTVMFAALEDSSKTGRILKAKTGWEENRGGTDDVGFSALPAGVRSHDGEFVRAGYYAYFWSATEWVANATSSYYAYLGDYDEAEINYQNKFEAMPVRCVQDPVLQKEVLGSLIDPRDGREYITVKIGSQTWMAENLSYAAEGSLCYQGNPDNCEYYGRLYDWNTAMGSGSSRDVCPQKWHVPSREEWLKLYAAVGGSASAEKVLKSRTDWKNTDDGAPGTGTNDVGFDALPAGNASGEFFYNQGYQTFFWSSTEYISGEFAYYMTLDYGGEGGSLVAWNSDLLSGDKRVFFSVRCVKD